MKVKLTMITIKTNVHSDGRSCMVLLDRIGCCQLKRKSVQLKRKLTK